jgi:hypothetical protein
VTNGGHRNRHLTPSGGGAGRPSSSATAGDARAVQASPAEAESGRRAFLRAELVPHVLHAVPRSRRGQPGSAPRGRGEGRRPPHVCCRPPPSRASRPMGRHGRSRAGARQPLPQRAPTPSSPVMYSRSTPRRILDISRDSVATGPHSDRTGCGTRAHDGVHRGASASRVARVAFAERGDGRRQRPVGGDDRLHVRRIIGLHQMHLSGLPLRPAPSPPLAASR